MYSALPHYVKLQKTVGLENSASSIKPNGSVQICMRDIWRIY